MLDVRSMDGAAGNAASGVTCPGAAPSAAPVTVASKTRANANAKTKAGAT